MHEGKDDRDDGGDDVSRLGDFDLQWFVVVALVVVLIIGALWAGRADGAEPPAQAPPVQAPPVVRVQAVRSDTPPTPAAGRGVAARAVGAVPPPVQLPPVLLGWNVTGPDGTTRFVPATSAVVPAPGVPVPYPFRRGPAFDGDHQCNQCGAHQYDIAGWNADGTHTHTCGRCGSSWRH